LGKGNPGNPAQIEKHLAAADQQLGVHVDRVHQMLLWR
jgi:hypothetical protein